MNNSKQTRNSLIYLFEYNEFKIELNLKHI